ncbi:MAG: Ketoisovalerate oxidoreductase subunit VorA [Candidatus Methanofastidiosum methylothiophilum]|uniref:Ketoisovalerate oxidoreductase subunit VorA n=1 Tax=Candidatus Methanofastidiosum methylothiophilum TaxID=1705564 RepID=A0A150ILX2_9EURY|nr:MAG: Ketoisovalerate oxidoreductase subunit VorA [Candidatus Methanofastidiosum methylthiophilus]KYC48630.1 MAG: Ketoisovalerate oxidoreductase subunit VorA [Candidatus Methanofastidiosum methylthiophilus]KYC51165.1 MAG: Ketoisovalerate oxidoreductase subunit VorA [Candidatus Methanofastidiosum methylthiophilus]
MVKKIMTGNIAAAWGARLSRAEVIAAYPITPQTIIVEKLAQFVSDGELKAEYLHVESEHSAMAACIAASQTGARTFTATSSQGLVLMHELLHWASGARAPIVMANVNRALAPPWSVWVEHTDMMSQRDTGWIQFYAESNQEVLDTTIMCYKLCEDKDIQLPAMIGLDAFYLSHTSEIVDIPDQEKVDKFLPKFEPAYPLDVENPLSIGSLSMPHQWYPEFRYKIQEAMERVIPKLNKIEEEFYKEFGRKYTGPLELYNTEDAEVVLIISGAATGTVKETVDILRKKGIKVGVIRLRMFRPFPSDYLVKALSKISFIGVIDRSFSFGHEGAIYSEIKASLYGLNAPLIKNFIVGMGGRDITTDTITKIYENCFSCLKNNKIDIPVEWIDIKV